jgi:RNA polymerase sigma-70 factor (ECF subfamily)
MTSTEPRSPSDPTRENLGELLTRFRPRLERMLAVRLDPRVRRRIDPDDVLQEAFLEISRRLDDYLARRPMPFFLWVRLQTGQKLAEFRRRHLEAAQRDAAREVTPGSIPAASSASLANRFADPGPSPSQEAAREEALARVQAKLEGMEEVDREILALRYFEGLSSEEAATVLGISLAGAKKRLVMALRRLRSALPAGDVPTP